MAEFNYQNIDDMFTSRIRLAIVSVLVRIEEVEFNYLKKKIEATDGNLSVHLKKLDVAGYIKVNKSFVNRKPLSKYKLTKKGRKAFEDYVLYLENIIKK